MGGGGAGERKGCVWQVWGEEKCIQCFDGVFYTKQNKWNAQAQVNNIIKIDLRKIIRNCHDWIDLSQDTDRFRTLLKSVMSPQIE